MPRFRTKDDVKKALARAEGGTYRQDVWALMDEDEAVDEVLADQNFEYFLDRYRKLAALGVSTTGTGPSRKTPRREPALTEVPPDRRLETLAQVIAVEMGKHPGIAAFRREVLGGKLLRPEEVPAWIERQAREDGPATTWVKVPLPPGYKSDPGASRLAWIKALEALPDDARQTWPEEWGAQALEYVFPGDQWVHRIAVRADGVLGRLKALAASLKEIWPTEAWAVMFILTGMVLPIPKARITFSFPKLAPTRIVIEADARLSKDEVAAIYAKARNRVFRGHDVPMTEKHLALAVFIAETRGSGNWSQMLKQWNTSHPDWKYSPADVKNFARDARLAWERVIGKKWGSPPVWQLDPAKGAEMFRLWRAIDEDQESPRRPEQPAGPERRDDRS